jgi:transglutaminase-like putative cysteine protease
MSRRAILGLLLVLGVRAATTAAGAEEAVYRLSGADAHLFDQYDIDGYSLAVTLAPGGVLLATVRAGDHALASAAPMPGASSRDPSLLAAPDRDHLVRTLTRNTSTEVEGVVSILGWVASEIHYDPDRLRLQTPSAVFSSRRAYCVGYSELAVDLLRRAGILARTVQGILATDPGDPDYDARLGGVYHRWIEVFYPDRGWVFSDPASSINGVDVRYLAFGRRAWVRPRDLHITRLSLEGSLRYTVVPGGSSTIRMRRFEPAGPGGGR